MPTIRDVVQLLASRDGVEAVVVLGPDGLTIDSKAMNGFDVDGLAALVPQVVNACHDLGSAASRGTFGVAAVEYTGGLLVLAKLTSEALLAIAFLPESNIGGLLYELQRHRASIAGLL
ncbi:MAG TPA: roadblock/LC7 domain-containing protein [Gemmatimonadales bacterium]|jgi:predicted regulator of Ras-like GTPase activity (Roadblock/LC7/MglB family)